MEFAKNMSFSLGAALIGAIFIVLGVSDGFTISNFDLAIGQTWAKIVLILLGFFLVLFAVFFEIKTKIISFDNRKTDSRSKIRIRPNAEDFFYTLDEKGIESFPELINGAVSIKIMGRTIVNLLNLYEKELEQIGKTGCELKFLLVNPESSASKSLYGVNPEAFHNNAIATARHLERLINSIGANLQTRIINKAPTVSIVIIEKNESIKGILQIQFYFLHSARGRDRPIFNIQHGDKYFKTFVDEFNELWNEGSDWKIRKFLDKNL